MQRFKLLLALCVALSNIAFSQKLPLSQRDACRQFSPAVVSIDAGGVSKGSGFIVSSDGLILTASHVVRNEDGSYFSIIEVHLSTGEYVLAKPAIPLSLDNVSQDYALLKVEGKISAAVFAFRVSCRCANWGRCNHHRIPVQCDLF